MSATFEAIVAVDAQMGIGRAGTLPWHLPSDLKHFRMLTTDSQGGTRPNAVIMGRRTWESLPDRFRPLPGRTNVVVSRTLRSLSGAVVTDSLEAAVNGTAPVPPAPAATEGVRRFVIGGAGLFETAFASPALSRIHLTEIDADFGCDVFCPPWPVGFVRIDGEWADEGALRYRFVTLEKRAATP